MYVFAYISLHFPVAMNRTFFEEGEMKYLMQTRKSNGRRHRAVEMVNLFKRENCSILLPSSVL